MKFAYLNGIIIFAGMLSGGEQQRVTIARALSIEQKGNTGGRTYRQSGQ